METVAIFGVELYADRIVGHPKRVAGFVVFTFSISRIQRESEDHPIVFVSNGLLPIGVELSYQITPTHGTLITKLDELL